MCAILVAGMRFNIRLVFFEGLEKQREFGFEFLVFVEEYPIQVANVIPIGTSGLLPCQIHPSTFDALFEVVAHLLAYEGQDTFVVLASVKQFIMTDFTDEPVFTD